MFPGVCIGINAAIISIVTEWLSDMKMGYCSDGWWLNQQFCCWEIEGDEMDGCESWRPWTTVSFARWIVFVFIAVSSSLLSPLRGIITRYKCFALGYVCVRCLASCEEPCEVCSWFWYFRNQVYSSGIYYARLFGLCDLFHQEYNVGELVFDPNISFLPMLMF